MKGIFVDKSLSNLDDVLALSSNMASKFGSEGNFGHYLKF